MKIEKITVIYCLSASGDKKDWLMSKVEFDTSNNHPFLSTAFTFAIPQIGSRMVMEGKTWNIEDVRYDYDKSEVTVFSESYMDEVRRKTKERREAEIEASEVHPRNAFGKNCPHIKVPQH